MSSAADLCIESAEDVKCVVKQTKADKTAKERERYYRNRESILAKKKQENSDIKASRYERKRYLHAKNKQAVLQEKKGCDYRKKCNLDKQNTMDKHCMVQVAEMPGGTSRQGAAACAQNYAVKKNQSLRRGQLARMRRGTLKRTSNILQHLNSLKLKGSLEVYTRAVASKIQIVNIVKARLASERIIKWVTQRRRTCIKQSSKLLRVTKLQAVVMLARFQECQAMLPHDQLAALCGPSKHSSFSEPYFHGCTYKLLATPTEAITMNELGQAVGIFPAASKQKRKRVAARFWSCSDKTCNLDSVIIIRRITRFLKELASTHPYKLISFVKRLDTCSSNVRSLGKDKKGHPIACHMALTACASNLLLLRLVAPHYPQIRNLVQSLYGIQKFILNIIEIDDALKGNNVSELKLIADTAEMQAREFALDSNQDCLCESQILEQYKKAFYSLTKRTMDLPIHDCLSCEKLCFSREVISTSRLRKPLVGEAWEHLQAHNATIPGKSMHTICRYCLAKFRKNEMPPTCVLNGLIVNEVPPEISRLNTFELPLIQRARAFQTVQRMGTVASKHIPNREKVCKSVGRTFHLPLPLEQTLKKLPLPQDPVNKNPEVYVLVNSLPSKHKIIWQNLVNVDRLYAALLKLKQTNHLYKDIVLPGQAKDLLDGVQQQVLFEPELCEDSEDVDDPSQDDQDNPVTEGAPTSVVSFNYATVSNPCEVDSPESDSGTVNPIPAMLALVDPEESERSFEEFTIYPMYESKDSRSASALYQMLKVYEAPLTYKDGQIDVKCFPNLFCDGLYGQFHTRNFVLKSAEFIKSRLKSKHSRFRLNQQYLFYLVNDANIRQLGQGIYQQLKIVNPRERLTAAQWLVQMASEELESNLTTIFSKLRNTEPFWAQPRNNLRCMTQSYGPATWFMTISPSEWDWDDLAQYLRDINGESMSGKSPSELVALDPVSTSRFIDNKFQGILDFITSPDAPLGKVTHYFWRREYQGRGMQHFHMLLWVEGAPVLGISSPEDVANFITKYVTCCIPKKDLCPILHERVTRYQVHRDNSYCMRKKKTKAGTINTCRFGFPRRPTDVFVLHDVATSIAGRKSLSKKCRLYEVVRRAAEVRVNDYNPAIMLAWKGNMDIQYVMEQSAVLNGYVTKYTTKAEKGNMRETFDIINSTGSLCSRLYNFGLRALSHRECGALEAADTLLGIPLYGTDPNTTIKWIDCNMVRARRLQPVQHIKSLAPDSTELFYESMVDDHYPNRPEALLDVSLYDFVAWYDIVKALPTGELAEGYQLQNGRYIKKRKRAYLVNHYKFNYKTQPEKYFYSLLLLFKPWTDVDELKGEHATFASAFNAVKGHLLEANRYSIHLQQIQAAAESVREQVDTLINRQLSEDDNSDYDAQIIDPLAFAVNQGEASVAMAEFRAAADIPLTHNDIDKLVGGLNSDQRRVFDCVVSSLRNKTDSETVLRHFVSGVGGTGKSYLIHAIKSWVKVHLKQDTAIGAPTGVAAFNVSGMTIFRLLQLPVEHGDMPKYKELSDAALKVIRDELKNVALLIIDEISMVSNLTLMYIHLRLSEVFNTKAVENGWFGKVSILLFGDLLQLPPVHDKPPFCKLSGEQVDKYLGSLSAINLWRELFTYDELTINMRQLNDAAFVDMLHRIRIGVVTQDDCQLLETRKVSIVAESVHGRLQELSKLIASLPPETVCLLPTRKLCFALNEAMLREIPLQEIALIAEDRLDCLHNANYIRKRAETWLSKHEEDCSRTAGLERVILIKIGAKVMLRRNLDVSIGLVNGALAIVMSVKKNIDAPNRIESITLKFANGLVKDIEMVESKFEILTGAYIYRKQFPITVSYAMTIHKAQGLTLHSAVLDIGTSVFSCGQIYVALSRVSSLHGLYLINFNPSNIKALSSAVREYNRLRKRYCKNFSEIPEPKRQPAKRRVEDVVWAPCINSLEIQGASVDDKQPKKLHNNRILLRPGFNNLDGASCYANATLQCFLHLDSVREDLILEADNGPLKCLADAYSNATSTMDATPIRVLVDNTSGSDSQFASPVQQDASEFLMALMEASPEIRNHTNFQENWVRQCGNCGVTNTSDGVSTTMLHIDVPTNENDRHTTLQALINQALAWEFMDSVCERCSSRRVRRRLQVSSLGHLLVVHFKIFEFKNNTAKKIMNLKLRAVPTTNLQLGRHTYQPVCGVFHLGVQMTKGHYIAHLRHGNSWMRADDNDVRLSRWPPLAKDLVLLVLQKIS